ncbi:MAG: nicotinate-nucleotide adenylyltransferase [Defluviitaleaceae bacterium]|nr:nicotinate-nucleotide adenylyltransferase [Defluviitaleaceae bacterium]
MRKIGIMGGTFDPIHNGHLRVAEEVRQALGLDEVIFMPAGNPVLKQDRDVTSAQDRFAMCLLATADNPHFSVSDSEIKRAGITYTVDTILELHKLHPAAKLFFIVGTDAAEFFHKWRGHQQILENCQLVVVARNGDEKPARDCVCGDFHWVEITQLDISSTQIRQHMVDGKSIKYLVPDGVREYINKQGLYKGQVANLSTLLAIELSRPRYNHSLEVMKEALALGRHYNADEATLKKLEIAGLLHDCAKNMCEELPYNEIEEVCNRSGYPLPDFFRKVPILAHGYMGAVLAKRVYGIDDPEISSAISCHTFGKPNMSFLEKVIYLADFIEPTRPESRARATARELAYKNIDKAMIFVLELIINRNKSLGRDIYPKSQQALDYLEEHDGS